MSKFLERGYSFANAWRMLCGYHAALQHDGDTPSAGDVARRLGFAVATGVTLRRGCIELGWVTVVEPPRGQKPGRLRLTAAGLAAVRVGAPPPEPAPVKPLAPTKPVDPPKSAAAKRRCLCCGTVFVSSGPHNRICSCCRGTESYRSGDVGSFVVRLP